MPTDVEDLLKIPGIGLYTSGAIASLAFSKVVPLVDGNVIRVLTRLRALKQRPTASKTIWNLTLSLVKHCTPKNISNFNQSLMELGNQICIPKKPKCNICPVKKFCHSFKEAKLQKRPYTKLFQHVKSEQCSLCEPIYFPTLLIDNYPLKKNK